MVRSSPMLRDPISDAIGLSAIIASATGLSVTAGTVVGGASILGGLILGAGASIGLNYAASLLRGNGTSAIADTSATDSQAIQFTERQAVPSRRIIYGNALTSGVLFFEAVKPPYLYQGLLLSAKAISAFAGVQVGTQPISFASLTPGAILTPIAVDGQPDFPGNLQVSLRLGSPTQTIDPLLARDFASLDASFRQQGIATAVMRYSYGADYTAFTALWGQVQRPNPLFLLQGVAVPDPRIAGHILDWDPSDPVSTAAAEATWAYSNNASLVQAHYLTQRYGGRILPSRMRWDKVAQAADWDDGLVGCNDGTYIKRYTIDGVVTLDQSPAQVLADMLTANRGFVLESAGRSWVSSSLPRQPVATIHDGLLTGAVSYQASKAKRDLVNRVRTQFVAADREYQDTVGPILTRPDLIAADGELLDVPLTLPFTMDDRRAQRLAKAWLETGRLGATISCVCDVALLANCSDELVGNSVNFDSALFAQMNGVYFVLNWGFADSFSSINLSLTQYDPSIETDWNPSVDEAPFTLVPLNLS